MVWQTIFAYRLNFAMWRLRTVILRLTSYFFWYAVYRFNKQVGSYNESMMLTYILTGSILHSLVLTTRSARTAIHIASGDLNNFLIKPLNYFTRTLFLDLGGKAANLFFLFLEMIAIFLILKPPFFIQTNIIYLLGFIIISVLSLFLFFYLSLIISLTAFWYPEHNGWPARFLFNVSNRFLSGSLIPLDVLPVSIFNFLRFLPTSYFIFFPLQIYLGKISQSEILAGFFIMLFWVFILRILVKLIWSKGLKNYTAVGI